MIDMLLRDGRVVDAADGEPRPADVIIAAGRIERVVEPGSADALIEKGTEIVACSGRIVMPGFVDAHSHADAAVLDDEIQLALLRQGVTTIITGQDGVSYAPGDGRYASEYFAALLGSHPTYNGGGVDGLLAGYDGRTRVNVAYLVPHGTVRHQVMGLANRAATERERAEMSRLVTLGMSEGAIGLSTGLDYIPGLFADTEELALLCRPVAESDGVYVTHMRGGYETNAAIGVDELRAICHDSGVRGHISHYHGPAPLLVGLLDDARNAGMDLSFDAYPYRAGYTLLSMPMLPPDLLALGSQQAVARLQDASTRQELLQTWLPSVSEQPSLGEGWEQRMTLAYVQAPEFSWAAGLTIAEASRRSGLDRDTFVLEILSASALAVSAVMPLPPGRSVEDLAVLIQHEGHMLGTDGIYVGSHPHPRGWGSFTRLLARHVRDRADLGWAQASAHLSAAPATRFRLGRRGLLQPGYVADIAVVDPGAVADKATYDEPRSLATGISDVLVAGQPVLRAGELTTHLSGGGLRRQVDG